MQPAVQFAASGLPTCRKIGHAARSDMFRGKKEKRGKQLHPTYRQESGERMQFQFQSQFQFRRPVYGTRKERGESSSIDLLTRKR